MYWLVFLRFMDGLFTVIFEFSSFTDSFLHTAVWLYFVEASPAHNPFSFFGGFLVG
jgi:hypothetical protein